MSYTMPTPTTLKAHFPAFAAVADDTVQFNIDRAARSVDTTWTEGDYATAIELLACHYMTLAGLGTGATAAANAHGLDSFKVIKSGQLQLERASASGGAAEGYPAAYAGSLYGRQFYDLLAVNKPAVTVAAPALPAGVYPPYPWWPAWPY